jgi:hypothetical protein
VSTDHYTPLDSEPVSVHPPYTTYPGGTYRDEPTHERRAALNQALAGVTLGDFDHRFLRWLCAGDVMTVATLISLLHRTRAATATGGQPPARENDGGMS